jgi:proline iminopeptidase
VFLHGGPGSGTGLKDTVYFNPKEYRIVLIDQRGAGKSEPSVQAGIQ